MKRTQNGDITSTIADDIETIHRSPAVLERNAALNDLDDRAYRRRQFGHGAGYYSYSRQPNKYARIESYTRTYGPQQHIDFDRPHIKRKGVYTGTLEINPREGVFARRDGNSMQTRRVTHNTHK